jgi:hypothetical protein
VKVAVKEALVTPAGIAAMIVLGPSLTVTVPDTVLLKYTTAVVEYVLVAGLQALGVAVILRLQTCAWVC